MTCAEQGSMARSVFVTNRFGPFVIDCDVLHNWDVDAIAQRAIIAGGLVLVAAGALPLLTSVHGQQITDSALNSEVKQLRERLDRAGVDQMPVALALIVAHQKIEDEREARHEAFEQKQIWGELGTTGGLLLALFGWLLNHLGITFAPNERKRRST